MPIIEETTVVTREWGSGSASLKVNVDQGCMVATHVEGEDTVTLRMQNSPGSAVAIAIVNEGTLARMIAVMQMALRSLRES